MIIQKRHKRHRTKIVKKGYLLLPLVHRGHFYWLTRVKIERSFNGVNMQIINITELSA